MLKRLVLIVMAFTAMPAIAAELGEDGLHKAAWMQLTFKDMSEDLQTANDEGKRLLIMFEQRGCIYCTKMHNEVFPDPEIEAMLSDDFYVVQMNLFGDEEVTDFDGTVLSEKQMARRWGIMFTPTLLFLSEDAPESGNAAMGAAAIMPGAFGVWTTADMMEWVLLHGYDTEEHFQKYHARRIGERREAAGQ